MHRTCFILKYFRLQSYIALVLCLTGIVPLHVFAGEAPEALIIRTDRLPARTISDHSLVPARNPFSWPVDQLQRFEDSDAGTRKDPFADFILNGIIWTEKEPVAIINNIQLRRGDTIDGAKVQSIDKNSVIIANQKTSRTLRFPDSFVDLNKGSLREKN